MFPKKKPQEKLMKRNESDKWEEEHQTIITQADQTDAYRPSAAVIADIHQAHLSTFIMY